jgi:hypothetical protein
MKHRLTPGGQLLIDIGPTPRIDERMIKRCPPRDARGIHKPRLSGNGGAAPTGSLSGGVNANKWRNLAARGRW